MANVIRSNLNELVTASWSPADVGVGGGCDFLAIEISPQQSGLQIWGVEFGVATVPVAPPDIAAIFAHLFIDLPQIDPSTANIGALFGGIMNFPMHPTLNVQNKFFRRYARWKLGPPFDVMDKWDVPIDVPPGSFCTVVMSLWTVAATTFNVHPYLCVRGGERRFRGAPTLKAVV